MGKKISSSSIVFEELDSNDSSMERIFDEIANIPNKDKIKNQVPSDFFKHRKKKLSYKSISKPDKEIDLHGKTREESILMVKNFLASCFESKLKTGLIITGKGYHSDHRGPVLNKEVKKWLKKNGENYLKEYYDAPQNYGGSGAIWLKFKN